MQSLPLNLAAFITAGVLVIAVSFGMLQAGVFSDGDGGSAVSNPTQTPAVLEASATPTSPEPLETGPAGESSAY